MPEKFTPIDERHYDLAKGLYNASIVRSRDKQVQKIISGFGLGSFRELIYDGYEEVARDVVTTAKGDSKKEL